MWLFEERRALVGVAAAGAFAALMLLVALLGELHVALIHLLYVPVLAAGLLRGVRAALVAGGSATVLLVLATLVSASLASDYGMAGVVSSLVAFPLVGGAVGVFADRQRRLLAEARERALSEQSTGIMDARAFGAALDLRVNSGRAFALLLCAVGDTPNGAHADPEVVLERIAQTLGRVIRRDDEVAELSNGEFAVLTWSSTSAEANAACTRLERVLLEKDLAVVFGYAVCPYDGIDAVSVYRVAEQRRADRARTEGNVDRRLEARFGSA